MPETVDPPDPSAALVLFRVHVEALLPIMGRRKAERHLRLMAEILAQEENLSGVIPIRPKAEQKDMQLARRQAVAAFRSCLPAWVAKLPPR